VLATQLSRRCFADSPRRAPACAGAALTRAFFRNAARGTRGRVGTFRPPSRRLQIASHCAALFAATGVPAPHATISSYVNARHTKDTHDGLCSPPKSAVPPDHYPSLALQPSLEQRSYAIEARSASSREACIDAGDVTAASFAKRRLSQPTARVASEDLVALCCIHAPEILL
jgi:hypothetical protein